MTDTVGESLPQDVTTKIEEWAEGWLVGLKLAGVALRTFENRKLFVTDHLRISGHAVTDNLFSEPLEALP